MASLVYNSFWDQALRGQLDVDGATYKVMLTTSAYVEDKDAHIFRSAVTNEVAAGAGYTAGGETATVTVTKDTANDRIDIVLGGVTWTTTAGTTLTARKAVYYTVVGTAGTDQLVAVIDFGSDQVASNGGTLSLSNSTIRLNNA
jgi:membrane protein implicated in regulation of membrane protease activity